MSTTQHISDQYRPDDVLGTDGDERTSLSRLGGVRCRAAAKDPNPLVRWDTVGTVERGGSVYDDPEVFQRYVRKRDASAFDPNHVMEEPALLAELGDPIGRRVVDLGCGDGTFGAILLAAGAAGYLGIDGSRTMVEQARRRLADTDGRVVLGDLEDFTAPPGSADLVTCRQALHYVEDVRPVLDAVAHCLTPGGRFVMTEIGRAHV